MGPTQRPRIHKVHGAAVPCPSNGICFGEGIIIVMGPIAASMAIAERDGVCIASPNHRQPQDRGNGQDKNNLLPRKGLESISAMSHTW